MSSSFAPNDLNAFWLPFTPNRHFKAHPRMLVGAEGMYYEDDKGRRILDAISGLWCVNAGHGRAPIVDAIRAQAGELDYAPNFQFAHPKVFAFCNRLAALAPAGLDRVFLCNSGSEAVESALKIARAYFKVTGDENRFRLVGRERAYHGVNFGGISVGGLPNNRKYYTPLLPGTEDHLPLPYDPATDRFTRGEGEGGSFYADVLEDMDPTTIAAIIVEPMTGSGGVYAAPKDYLGRLRALCDRYGILLIFDEVITAFGRLGYAFAAERYGVAPDMICFAKGVTNGSVPLGGVLVRSEIYDAFPEHEDYSLRLTHGYTYTGHPLAAAAGLATLDLYRDEGLFERGRAYEPVLGQAVHGLRGAPFVTDIRNVGLAAAIDLEAIADHPGKRGYEAMIRLFEDENLLVRLSGDSLVLAPSLIVTEAEIGRMTEAIAKVLGRLA